MTQEFGKARVSGQNLPKVRLLGTTWADRGWRYWSRRFWLVVAYALIAALEWGIAFSIWSSLAHSTSPSSRTVITVVAAALVIGGFVWALRTLWEVTTAEHRHDIPKLRAISERNSGRSRGRAASAGSAIGVGGLAGSSTALLTVAVGVFAVLGWAVVALVMSLMRYISVEEYLAVHDYRKAIS
jgi:MFS family permease